MQNRALMLLKIQSLQRGDRWAEERERELLVQRGGVAAVATGGRGSPLTGP
jgi:hypothetical protein